MYLVVFAGPAFAPDFEVGVSHCRDEANLPFVGGAIFEIDVVAFLELRYHIEVINERIW